MKINDKVLRKMIKEEISKMTIRESYEGSFYDTNGGALFDKLMGLRGMQDALYEAMAAIQKIQDVAQQCQSAEQYYGAGDEIGGGFVDEDNNIKTFRHWIDYGDEIIAMLDLNKFLNPPGL